MKLRRKHISALSGTLNYVKYDHFTQKDYLVTVEQAISAEKPTYSLGLPPTLKEGPKVKSDHIRRFQVYDFL